ncbi:hypothetical protein [Egbenema bharatensis]|uniref:hypothetical protein n=1 Tax=Egbenema bharatensis TaxID=3463334 RepID=UPI003A85EDA4
MMNYTTSSKMTECQPDSAINLHEAEPVRLCGIIFRFNEKKPGEPRTSLDDAVRIRANEFEINFLTSTDPQVQAVLNSIRAPHDRFYGCVYGTQLPLDGFEGPVFGVDRIELIREWDGAV